VKTPRATELAHQWVSACLSPDGIAVDATAGNGHDTVFLAQRTGRVFAFDIQAAALESTREKLQREGLRDRVELIQAGHETLAERLAAWSGQIQAVMFNLGYLPGGDHALITRESTSLRAIDQALSLLAPGGIVTVMMYPNHPGGGEEAAAILRHANELEAQGWVVRRHETPGPVLHSYVKREREDESPHSQCSK